MKSAGRFSEYSQYGTRVLDFRILQRRLLIPSPFYHIPENPPETEPAFFNPIPN